MDTYKIDSAMTGGELTGAQLVELARLLTEAGYPSEAITDSHNGASNDVQAEIEPPDSIFWECAALAKAGDK